jgi:hypothetical protein
LLKKETRSGDVDEHETETLDNEKEEESKA